MVRAYVLEEESAVQCLAELAEPTVALVFCAAANFGDVLIGHMRGGDSEVG